MTDYIKLAHRAVNCNKWRWVDGMVPVRSFASALGTRLPDLTDPATVECVIDLAREAWGCHKDRMLITTQVGDVWCVVVKNRVPTRHRPVWCFDKQAHPSPPTVGPLGENTFTTAAEAAVAALEAAP